MFVFVEGGDRLPHSSAVHHLQHFVLSILLVNNVQKVKHTELQKNSRVPFTNAYILNGFLLVQIQILLTEHSKKPVSPTALATTWEGIPAIGFGASRTPFPTIYG